MIPLVLSLVFLYPLTRIVVNLAHLNASRRTSLLLSFTLWGFILLLITETLSLFKALEPRTLYFAWLAILLLISFVLLATQWMKTKKESNHASHDKSAQAVALPIQKMIGSLRNRVIFQFSSIYTFLGTSLIFITVMTLAMVAYQYPPNNHDSMTYHMARIAHWQQERSVAPYPSNIIWQIQWQPFAEFIITHLQILSSSDWYANFVQLFALLLCAIAVSEIAAKLGAGKKTQLTAALISIAIPTGLLEATTTQNDYVVAAWLTIFITLGLSLIERPDSSVWIIGTGLSLGLALLTKATAYLFALPFCVWIGIRMLRVCWRQAIISGMTIAAIIVLVNAGHFLRNLHMFGTPLGPTSGYHNDIYTPGVLLSNMIRNAALNVPVHTQVPLLQDVIGYIMSWLRNIHELT